MPWFGVVPVSGEYRAGSLARDLLEHALRAGEQARGSVADIEREARRAVHDAGEQA